MSVPEENLRYVLDVSERLAESSEEKVAHGDYKISDLPSILTNLAEKYRRKAQSHALLEEKQQALDAYGQAARYSRESIDAIRKHSDEIPRTQWEDAPPRYIDGMRFALISRDHDLCSDIAAEALELEHSYLDEFASKHRRNPVHYFKAKTLAAAILDDDRFTQFAVKFDEAIDHSVTDAVREEKHLSTDFLLLSYSAIHKRDPDRLVAILEKFLRGRAYNTPLDTEDPDELVDNEIIALCLLATDTGISVTIDSPSVPPVLVPDLETADYVIEIESDEQSSS